MVYTRSILGFSGEYRFLSNFYPVEFEVDGELYTSSEQFYMAAKCADPFERAKIMAFDKPSMVKKLGSKVKLVDGWDDGLRDKAMFTALKAKFSTPKLKGSLYMTTGAYLEETNHWGDTYWGVCDGVGQNKLGRMLMWLRDHHLFKKFEDCPQ